jgi:NADPH:quinone reductase-like Zn-dependent oxidoreductase/acyl carrier protein
VVTSGVQSGVPTHTEWQRDSSAQLLLAPLYGLVRVIINEHPELRPTIVDLSLPVLSPFPSLPHYQSEEIAALARELQHSAQFNEVCLRGSERFLNRVERTSFTRLLRSDTLREEFPDLSFRLMIDSPGLLSRLALHTVPRRQPGSGQVAIDVVASGLNFKDVAIATGLITPDTFAETQGDYTFGLECAGRIAALGEGVNGFQLGDEVIAIGPYSFSDWLVVDERYVMRKPGQMSMQAAAGILCVFLTAHYALNELAHIQAGERVLIHGAAGGVGLAAIQVVQQAGGEIFATAGTEEKRAYLRALGVQHVFDSRSLAFIDGILQQTRGEGVDIVLNSVAGEVAARSLDLLRSFGRFLEIGKRDFQEHSRLRLYPFERCLTYYGIDLGRLLSEAPNVVKRLMGELVEHFEQGRDAPLPYHLYPLDQTVEAFRFMQQSRQIGKIVIQVQQQSAPVIHSPDLPELRLREDGSYLITGGLGGFGLSTAGFLVAQGARYLILASRRGRPEPEDASIIEQFRQAGVQVMTERLDVTSEPEVAALFSRIEQDMPPLRGIIHAAMVLSDQAALQMDQQLWERALAPKMLGAWHLHRQSIGLMLDFFVCYSSVSMLVGNAHQGNYVAGNAFLEALACYRRARSLPALTISWGALAQVGYVARKKNISDFLDLAGLQKLDPHLALELLGKIIQARYSRTIVARIQWNKLTAYYSHTSCSIRWRHLCTQEQKEMTGGGEQHVSNARTALNTMTKEDRQGVIFVTLQQLMQQIVGQSFSFDLSLSLKELGIDSLMAMELRMGLRQLLEIDIPLMQLLQLHTIADLVDWIDQQLLRRENEEQVQFATQEVALRLRL